MNDAKTFVIFFLEKNYYKMTFSGCVSGHTWARPRGPIINVHLVIVLGHVAIERVRDRLQRRVDRVERHQRERVEQRGARKGRGEGVRDLQRAQQE